MHDRFHGLGGILAVTATYVYFLIFAQLAFLEQVTGTLDPSVLEPVMLTMGATGILASFLTAELAGRFGTTALLRLGFSICLPTALLATRVATTWQAVAIAAIIGLGLAILTVSLATGLVALTGRMRFGLRVGLGTGTAYWICNLPPVFSATPDQQALIAAAACALGLVATAGYPGHPRSEPAQTTGGLTERDVRGWGFTTVLICFLALIWLDSGLFYVIQQNTALKAVTWTGNPRFWLNGSAHLVAALVAGLLIDRGRFRGLLVWAFAFLAAGTLVLARSGSAVWSAAPLYVIGVSIYSTALVAYPCLRPDATDAVPRRRRAGLIYGIAGWLGSALGIGMVRDLEHIPISFLVIAGAVILIAWRGFGGVSVKRVAAVTASLLALGSLPLLPSTRPDAADSETTAIQRGRDVYIAEGCINCHSQYVRPNTGDVLIWGPAADPETLRAQSPPLFGNRRQGPDLLRVGNRRSAAWQRAHLIDPRGLSPGSVMPAYGHLFEDGRGDDLIAYLTSLGAATVGERMDTINAWRPEPTTSPITMKHAMTLFTRNCAPCHGRSGRGDGPYAHHWQRPATDLARAPFRFVRDRPDDPTIARAIKFGIPGTDMPGHETLTDREISGLARYIVLLRARPHGDRQ